METRLSEVYMCAPFQKQTGKSLCGMALVDHDICMMCIPGGCLYTLTLSQNCCTYRKALNHEHFVFMCQRSLLQQHPLPSSPLPLPLQWQRATATSMSICPGLHGIEPLLFSPSLATGLVHSASKPGLFRRNQEDI